MLGFHGDSRAAAGIDENGFILTPFVVNPCVTMKDEAQDPFAIDSEAAAT